MIKNTVYIIAEAGVNHNGDLNRAIKMIEIAADCGADAIKFQTFIPDLLASKQADKAQYQQRNDGKHDNQLDMLKKLTLTFDEHKQLRDLANKLNIEFLSSPFDLQSADFLINDLQLKRIKIGSGEITHAPLLLKIAQSHLPIILSTGMSTLKDIKQALAVIAYGMMYSHLPENLAECLQLYQQSEQARSMVQKNVHLLHCTTEYPCPIDEVNLNIMNTLSKEFHLPVGYSDHTQGINVSIAAAAKGACIIEKHFTLDKHLKGPDHMASLEPKQLQQMITAIREVSTALGSNVKQATPSEQKNAAIARKSLMANSMIKAGELFSIQNLTAKRPGSGISPMHYWDYIGQVSQKNYQPDDFITPHHLDDQSTDT